MARKERISTLSIVRALAMLGVISVHATSETAAMMKTSSLFYGYTFFNIFFKYGTPTFILLSSLVLFYNYGGGDKLQPQALGKFYKNRFRYVFIPYLICSVFYFMLVQVTWYPDRSWSEAVPVFVTKLLTGTAYTHLYFVFISIQFYLLFPLLLMLFRSRRVVAWAIPLGLVLQWGYVLWNKYGVQIPAKGSISLSYISFYFAGAYLGINFHKVRPWLDSWGRVCSVRYKLITGSIWLLWLGFALLHVQIWYWTRSTGKEMNSLIYELLWNGHTLLSAIVLIQLAFYLERRLPELGRRLLSQLGDLSFGIYLIHPAFLALYRQFPWHKGSASLYPIFIFIGYVFALGMSWIIVYGALRFIPGASFGLGASPRDWMQNRKNPAAAVEMIRSTNAS
ncbi:acyltransferase [Paenibacillus sp. MER 180]|uniref:acyltransferase n=1 Tax=Paenibacillus sp. MER 180 TaxID=2939570 RepID=UPI00203D5B0E|nr:acyltransferase [Paenibacillus sp. MER 180]MCM3293776.1 acyltransferase [Paenibacillus sp. MER 180]